MAAQSSVYTGRRLRSTNQDAPLGRGASALAQIPPQHFRNGIETQSKKVCGFGQHLTTSLWTSSCTTSSAAGAASAVPPVAFPGDRAVCTDDDRRKARWGAEMGAVLPGFDPLHCAVLDIMPSGLDGEQNSLSLVGQAVKGRGAAERAHELKAEKTCLSETLLAG